MALSLSTKVASSQHPSLSLNLSTWIACSRKRTTRMFNTAPSLATIQATRYANGSFVCIQVDVDKAEVGVVAALGVVFYDHCA